MSTSRKTFTAVYDGSCNECGDDIFEGDEIAYLDDDVVCADCWRESVDSGSENWEDHDSDW